MASISVTNTFVNATTAVASEVNANFTDIINGTSDGSKDLSMLNGAFAGTLGVTGVTTLNNAITYMAGGLVHLGDTNTAMAFETDKIEFTCGGVTMLSLIESAADEVVINEDSASVDLRVETDTNLYGLLVDSSKNTVAIGTATATANADLRLGSTGVLDLKETTTPTADTNFGKIYTKNDNKLYFQDGAGTEYTVTIT